MVSFPMVHGPRVNSSPFHQPMIVLMTALNASLMPFHIVDAASEMRPGMPVMNPTMSFTLSRIQFFTLVNAFLIVSQCRVTISTAIPIGPVMIASSNGQFDCTHPNTPETTDSTVLNSPVTIPTATEIGVESTSDRKSVVEATKSTTPATIPLMASNAPCTKSRNHSTRW